MASILHQSLSIGTPARAEHSAPAVKSRNREREADRGFMPMNAGREFASDPVQRKAASVTA
jgi:hypothetical protein